ncbi:hypothetical protein [Embleya sp. NPDC059259]|uniref:hypothetical protein n=1 Tax=unclassified Embleya TaxID=2699296 RepID=UPI0036AE808C
MTEAGRGQLVPLGADLTEGSRVLAESLRLLFAVLDVSITRYAARCARDKGAVSRYLNGTRVPPWEFVVQLQDHVAKHTGRGITAEAAADLRARHRAVLQARNPDLAEVQRLKDALALADEHAQQAQLRERMFDNELRDQQQRVAELQRQLDEHRLRAEQSRVAQTRALERWNEENARLQTELARLRGLVTELEAELAESHRRVLEAENHCRGLELQLDAAESDPSDDADPAERGESEVDVWDTYRRERRHDESLTRPYVQDLRERHRYARGVGESGDPARAARLFAALADDLAQVRGSAAGTTVEARREHVLWTERAGDVPGAARLRARLTEELAGVRGTDADTLRLRWAHAHEAKNTGQLDEAARLFAVLADDLTRVHGSDHPEARKALHEERTCVDMPNTPAVEAAWSQVEQSRRTFGSDALGTLRARRAHAHALGQAGHATGAAQALGVLVEDMTRVYGADHFDTLNIRHAHAFWTGCTDDTTAAVRIYEELIPDLIHHCGPDHRDTLDARRWHAAWRSPTAAPREARELYALLLKDLIGYRGHEHPHTLEIRAALAHWTGKAGAAGKAAELYAILVQDLTRIRGAEHPETLRARKQCAAWSEQR